MTAARKLRKSNVKENAADTAAEHTSSGDVQNNSNASSAAVEQLSTNDDAAIDMEIDTESALDNLVSAPVSEEKNSVDVEPEKLTEKNRIMRS